MRELLDIVAAFESLAAADKPAALATVIGVDGSSYRRPGAKMLIAEDGRTWGGVSGGCLERDVVRNAIGVIATGRPISVRYDTADDEQLVPAASTGCGGTVEVFIQPITREQPGVLAAMAAVVHDRQTRTAAMIVRTKDAALLGLTSTGLVQTDGVHRLSDRIAPASVISVDPREPATSTRSADSDLPTPVFTDGRSTCVTTETSLGPIVWFVQTLRPPQSLVIFGAGPDVVPVVMIARTLGWQTTVVATPPATHVAERFVGVDRLQVTPIDSPASGVQIAADTAVLVMTHNVSRDAAILQSLADREEQPAYLGLLGPRHRTEKLLSNIPRLDDARLFSPIGLDLGAETPEEIALAIMAEIHAALRHASAEPLREKIGPIHQSAAATIPGGGLHGYGV